MIKLICISDTHHKHYYLTLPKGDILLHCGDFTYRGEKIERILMLDWLKYVSRKYSDIVIIMGNHDIGCVRETLFKHLPINVHLLQDNKKIIQGINFYGSPYTPRFGDWGFGETEDKLEARFMHIPKDTEILMTHGPAYSILDKNRDELCCGSKALYDKVKKLPKLKHHLFGHIHEQGGKQEVIEGITFSNCSVLDEYYELKHKPIVIDYA